MPSLKGRSPKSAYQELLKISNQGAGLDGSLRNIEDGTGNPTGIQIGTGMVAIFGYQFPASGFAAGKVLRVNATNDAFEWHSIAATDIPNLASIATTGKYSYLLGTPAIPAKLSDLTNDLNFVTTAAMQSMYGLSGYSLPIATASALGGIKVGSGLTINSSTGILSANVTTVAGRTGAIVIANSDVSGSAPLASPALTGTPTAPTATAGTNTTQLATTAFVTSAASTVSASIPTKVSQLTNDSGFLTSAPVTSVAGRTGIVTLSTSDISGIGAYALVASPTFTGVPAVPTAVAGTNTTQIASTAFVTAAANNVTANIPTKNSQLTNDSGFVTTLTAPVNSVAGRTGTITLSTTDISGISAYAPLAAPTFTGIPAAPTAAAGTNTTQLATTAFVTVAANAVSAAIPTKTSTLTNDSGFITAASVPVTSVAGRTGVITLSTTDISGINSYATLASPTFTGVPAVPTAIAGTNTTQAASTAFVSSAITTATPTKVSQLTNDSGYVIPANEKIQSVAGRTGTIVLSTTDVSGIGSYATLASPSFTGTPLVPTATAGTNTTQAASTAFVTSAISAYTAPVTSVAGRTGVITLSTTDISGIGSYAPLASPTFTGVPLAPTATAGTNTTQVATTAFVTAAIPTKNSVLTNDAGYVTASTAPVRTVAGRTGAITLAVADVSGAAPLASPVFTGSPTAPTPVWGDNSTAIATTAFVAASGMQFNGVLTFNNTTTLTLAMAGAAIINVAAFPVTFSLPVSSTVTAGKIFYITNQGSSTLAISSSGVSDLFKCGSYTLSYLLLNPSESAMITARAPTEYDLMGGTYFNRFPVRQMINTDIDDGVSALQVNGIATVTSPADGDDSNNVATTSWVNNTPYRRNKLINSRFDIWQRGTSWTTPVTGTYTSDRWRVDYAGTSAGAFTVGQALVNTQPASITSTVGPGGVFSWNHTTAPNLTSLMLSQRCEDAQTFSGMTCTVSFNVALGAGVQTAFTLGVNLAQCFGTGGSPSATVTTATQNFTVSSANWTRVTATFTLPVATGTFGTNANDYVAVQFILPTKQTFSFYLDHVQFEPGPVATPYISALVPDEMLHCQRYFTKTFPLATKPAINSLNYSTPILANTPSLGGAAQNVYWDFKVPMRGAPAIVMYCCANNANAYWTNIANGTAFTTTAATNSRVSEQGAVFTMPTGATASATYALNATADADL